MKQEQPSWLSRLSSGSLSRLAAYIVFAIAGLVLVGWMFNITLLKSVRAEWNSMKVITAFCLIMAAAAVLWLQRNEAWKRALCAVFGAALCGVAAASIVVYGVDLVTGKDPSWAAAPVAELFLGPTDRMALPTALVFLGLGGALLLLRNRRTALHGVGHAILLPVALMSYMVLVGYIFNAPTLHEWLGVAVALHTGIALCALCFGMFCARPDTWLTRALTGPEAGAMMARRLLAPLLALPLVVGWLRVYGERAGVYESEVGVALVAATYAVCFLFLVWWNSKVANRQQREAEESLREARDSLEIRVQERTSELGRTVQALQEEAAQRAAAEKSVRTASLYSRSLIEASLDPLVTISPEGRITDVNKATEEVTGIPRQKLIGSDFSGYFTDPRKASDGYRKVLAEGFVRDYPLTLRHLSGRTIDVLYNATLYRNEEGQVQGVFAAARDVTESKNVLRQFTETKNFLDNILQSSTKYSIIGKDLNHRILSWNEGARRNYGYSAEEIIGQDSSVLHVPEDVNSGAVDRLLKIAHEKGLAEGEFQRVRKDGSRFAASVVVTRRNDASGRPIGYLLMSNDISEKKQAEEQLRRASQYARSLIESSLDPLVTIRADGKITDVNEATIRVTGLPREQLIGTDFTDYFSEPEKAREGYQQVFAKGSVTDYPLTIRHKNGRLTDVLYNATVYRNEAGQVQGVFAAARDITRSKKLEQELRVASLYARSLIEASLDPLVTISPEGKITDVNRATEEATGLPRAQLIGSDFSKYFTDPSKANAGYRAVIARGFVRDYPLTLRHASGRTMDVLYNATVYRNEEGQVQGVFAAARDVTARKKMEEALRAASLYARSLIEASLDPLVTISPEGKITDVNSATEQATGVSRQKLIGSDFSDYFTEPDKAREGYQTVLAKGAVRDYPLTIRHVSGGAMDVLYNATLYRDESGKVIGVFAAARDVTERKAAEAELDRYRLHLEELVQQRTSELEKAVAELARSNKDLEQFAYVASHDLQEPLRAVGGFVSMLKHEYHGKLDDDAREYIQQAVEGAERMQALINDLLTYSRVGSRGGVMRRVEMKEALDAALANLRAAVEESDAVITCDPLPAVTADASQMVQLFQNLIGNAIKFRGPRRPEIHVSARRQEDRWVFSVRDNGIGIEPQYYDRIFLIFQRLHARTQYPGTGIGLAVCKRIAERHSGTISVESTPGEGTTFYFTIPEEGEDE